MSCSIEPAVLAIAASSFHREGYAVLPAFSEPAEVQSMRSEMAALTSEWWQATRAGASVASVFRTDGLQAAAQGSKDYFMSSGDKVRFFEEAGERSRGADDGMPPLNKVGHGLHLNASTSFGAYARSPRVAAVARAVAGLRAPVLPQSMYIFKGAQAGGAVTSHQDGSFLYTRPVQTVVGLWLALHDAHEGNGCLWARPGSHREPLRRRFVRVVGEEGDTAMSFANVSYGRAAGERATPEQEEASLSPRLLGEGEAHAVPQTATADAAAVAESGRAREWEGTWPAAQAELGPASSAALAARGFEPLPVKAGDLVVLSGTLDHLSLPNHSPADRHTFQLHMVEGPAAGVSWAPENWLQYEGGFMELGA